MKREILLEDLAPLTKLIAHELMAQLKENGFMFGPSVGPHNDESKTNNHRPLLTLKEAAAMLEHNYFWLSHNYRRLSLRPVQISGKRPFMRKEVESLLERQRARLRGRPSKSSMQPNIEGPNGKPKNSTQKNSSALREDGLSVTLKPWPRKRRSSIVS